MMNLITIQHCQSEQHLNGMVGGATDWPLTELGLRQAENIGAALAKELGPEHGYVMYSSDLTRTRQTAEIVARHLGVTPVFRENLREYNYGRATGKSKEWFEGNRAPCPADMPSVYHRYFPEAESGEDVYRRVSVVVRELEKSGGGNVIVVAHTGSLQMFTAAWLGIPITILEKMAFKGSAGGVSSMSVRADGMRILNRWNDLSYQKQEIE